MTPLPLPFPLGEHVQPVRVRLSHEVDLVLLTGSTGLLWALWKVRGQWTDAPIGRA